MTALRRSGLSAKPNCFGEGGALVLRDRMKRVPFVDQRS
jgi:hypothetical protein